MTRFKLSKLVRDKIVDKQLEAGSIPHFRYLNKTDHFHSLVDKITEEAQEILRCKEEDRIYEIADVQQVIGDLKFLLGIDSEQFEKAK